MVLLGRIQAEHYLFGLRQVGANAAVGQLLFAVHHEGQELHLSSVIRARLHRGSGIDRDRVGAGDRRAVQRKSDIGCAAHLEHHAVGLSTTLAAQTRLGDQIDILHRAQR